MAALLPSGGPARAEGMQLGAGGGRPVAITAESGLEWQQKTHVYIARGHATARRGSMAVEADRLTAHYRSVKGGAGSGEIYRINADGHVTINGPKETVRGDHAVYDLDRQIAVVTGKGLKLTTPKYVVTARDSLEWYDAKNIAVARGDAVAEDGDKRLRADVLTAYLSKSKGNGAAASPSAASGLAGREKSQIRRIDASGNVVASTPTDVGRGDYGVYDTRTGIVTLLGHVTITRGKNAIRGQYAVVDLNTGVSRMMSLPHKPGTASGPVEGIFVRQNGDAHPDRSAKPTGRSPTEAARKPKR